MALVAAGMDELFFSQARPLIRTAVSVARLHQRIDKIPAALGNDGGAFFERFHQAVGGGHRRFAVESLGPRHGNQIDVGVIDLLADPTVLRRTATHVRDSLLMQLVVEIRAVIRRHDHYRNVEMSGGPQSVDTHEIIAIADDTDGEPPGIS